MPKKKSKIDEWLNGWELTNPCNEIKLPFKSIFKDLEDYTIEDLTDKPEALTRKVLIEKVGNSGGWNINLEGFMSTMKPASDLIISSHILFAAMKMSQEETLRNTQEAIGLFQKGLEENRAERKVLTEKNDIFKTWINDAENDILPIE